MCWRNQVLSWWSWEQGPGPWQGLQGKCHFLRLFAACQWSCPNDDSHCPPSFPSQKIPLNVSQSLRPGNWFLKGNTKSFNYKMFSYFIHKPEKELVSIYYGLNILCFPHCGPWQFCQENKAADLSSLEAWFSCGITATPSREAPWVEDSLPGA